MLASCTSIPAGSFRETATAVGTVFSCVASRNRGCDPAPGFRDAGSRTGGRLYEVGFSGFSWSSTIPTGSGNARYLLFYYSWLYPQNSSNRAYGFPLRCLQEEEPRECLAGVLSA